MGDRLHTRHPQEHQDRHCVKTLWPDYTEHTDHVEGRLDVPDNLPRHHARLLLWSVLHVQLPEQFRAGLGLQHRGDLHLFLLGVIAGKLSLWNSVQNVAMFSNVAKSAASHNKLASNLILNAILLQKLRRKGLKGS